MYNQWQKNQFIDQYTNNVSYRDTCRKTFELFEEYELKWEADLCTRTSEELAPVIENLCGIRSKSIESRLVVLNEYVKWCQKEGIPDVRANFSEIKPSGIKAVKKMSVSSPRHLQYFLDSIFDPVSYETVDLVLRCVFWLAFAGVPDNEIANIKNSDINLTSMTIKGSKKSYSIYREGLETFERIVHITDFRVILSEKKDTYINRKSGDAILRTTNGVPSLNSIRNKIAVKRRKAKEKHPELMSDDFPELSYSTARISGLFYETFENERIGIPPDFTQFVYENRRTDVSKMNDKQRRAQKASEDFMAKKYLEDYQRWKVAHYY